MTPLPIGWLFFLAGMASGQNNAVQHKMLR